MWRLFGLGFAMCLAAALNVKSVAPPPLAPLQQAAHCPRIQSDSLRVLSWNVYLLPTYIAVTGQQERARYIIEVLRQSPYDVVALQEVFAQDLKRLFIKGLADVFPYHSEQVGADTWLQEDAGILFLSRWPIVEEQAMLYNDCRGVDCRSQKGVAWIEVDKCGRRIQLLNTHAQAFEGGARQQIRYAQYAQIRTELLDRHARPGVPQILLGDLNTNARYPERYRRMLDILGLQDARPSHSPQAELTYTGLTNDLVQALDAGYRATFDYVLWRKNEAPIEAVRARVCKFRASRHTYLSDLSDHYAVEAVFALGAPQLFAQN